MNIHLEIKGTFVPHFIVEVGYDISVEFVISPCIIVFLIFYLCFYIIVVILNSFKTYELITSYVFMCDLPQESGTCCAVVHVNPDAR